MFPHPRSRSPWCRARAVPAGCLVPGGAKELLETFPRPVLEDVCRAQKSLVPGQESG